MSYWGCAYLKSAETCKSMLDTPISQGSVNVKFDTVDHYIPCIKYSINDDEQVGSTGYMYFL